MKLRSILVLVALMAMLTARAQGDWGNVKGGVAFGADNGRLHPDVGAEVIVYYIDSVWQQGSDTYIKHRSEDSLVNNALRATMYYDLWLHSPIGRTQKQMVRKLKNMDAWPYDRLLTLEARAMSIITDRERRQYVHTTTDMNGHYGVRLRGGYYGLIYRSRALRTKSRIERRGKLLLDDLYIKAGQTIYRSQEIL